MQKCKFSYPCQKWTWAISQVPLTRFQCCWTQFAPSRPWSQIATNHKLRQQGFLFCCNLWLSQVVTVQNTTCQINANCARSSIAQSICHRAFSLLGIQCQRPWVWTFFQHRKTTCLRSNRKSFAVDLHNITVVVVYQEDYWFVLSTISTYRFREQNTVDSHIVGWKDANFNCVTTIYIRCSYLLVMIKKNTYHFICQVQQQWNYT